MSEKKAKMDRKLKAITNEADNETIAKEMAKSIAKMYEDRDKKAVNAKNHLIEQLEVTSDKYRTANGVMSALSCVRDVFGESCISMTTVEQISIAKGIASTMASVAQEMRDKASDLEPDNMNLLCDSFYDKEFSEHDSSAIMMATELMVLNLCQQVGPSTEDIVEFIITADKEIEATRDELKKLCEDNGLDFNEICGPHDDCYDCLCMDCANDCKEKKQIKEGQSAYDVCEKFVKTE